MLSFRQDARKTKWRKFFGAVSFTVCGALFALPGVGQAEPLTKLLPQILKTDPRIIQTELSNDISGYNVRSAYGAWLPSVELSGHYGYEEIQNQPASTDNTYFEARKFQAQLTQLLFDYRKYIGVKSSKKSKEISDVALEAIRQSITREAIQTYFTLYKTAEQLKYAKISEQNLLTQAKKEEARVKKGSGVSTDVLQAKSQLAGARATRVRAEGAYAIALNNFSKVFRVEIANPKDLQLPKVPYDKIPQSVDEVVEKSKNSSLTLKQARLAVEIAQLAAESAKSPYLPTVKLIGRSQFKEDDGGTEFEKREHLIKLDFTYNIFNGGQDYYARLSSLKSLQLSRATYDESERVVVETARNFWKNYLTARSRVQYLKKQVKSTGEFLKLARKERKLGKRSLLDVLNGEVNYIQSVSNAVAADTDMALAVYDLFYVMGKLDSEMVVD